MILALVADAMRVLLRGATLPLLLIVGVLLGLFVRATGAVEHAHLETTPLSGGAIEILLSTLFGAALIYAVADGIRLAHDDHQKGLVASCSVRPVSRLAFATGRVLGLCAAQLLGLTVLGVVALFASGLPFAAIPSLRRVVEASVVRVDDRVVEPGTEALLDAKRVARFEFKGGTRPEGQLRVRPYAVPGEQATGFVAVRVDLERAGKPIGTFESGQLRPHQAIPLRFDDDGSKPFTLVVRNEWQGFALAVEPEGLFLLGGDAGVWPDTCICILLTAFAMWVLGSIAYALGLALSLGPAALAAGFVWLLSQARSAVLDLIAGLGGRVDAHPPEAVLFARKVFAGLVRLVPDVSVFQHAARLGREQALADGALLAGVAAAAPLVLAAVVLAFAAAPFEER